MVNLGKTIDSAAVRFALFTLLLIWFDYIIGNFFGALAIAALTTLVIVLIIKKILEKTNWKRYPKDKLYTQFALLGNSYTLGLYAETKNIPFDGSDNYIAEDGVLYYCAFRFSALTADDIAAAYRVGLAEHTHRTVIICNKAGREVMALAATLYDNYSFVTAPDLYKVLKENDALPALITLKKPKDGAKLTLRSIIDVVFSESNVRYYLFSGALLAFMSFITPLKIYYLITATLSLIFAVIAKLRATNR